MPFCYCSWIFDFSYTFLLPQNYSSFHWRKNGWHFFYLQNESCFCCFLFDVKYILTFPVSDCDKFKILMEDYENCQSQFSWIFISYSSGVLNKQAKQCISVITQKMPFYSRLFILNFTREVFQWTERGVAWFSLGLTGPHFEWLLQHR